MTAAAQEVVELILDDRCTPEQWLRLYGRLSKEEQMQVARATQVQQSYPCETPS